MYCSQLFVSEKISNDLPRVNQIFLKIDVSLYVAICIFVYWKIALLIFNDALTNNCWINNYLNFSLVCCHYVFLLASSARADMTLGKIKLCKNMTAFSKPVASWNLEILKMQIVFVNCFRLDLAFMQYCANSLHK